ncbi:hypothetical protein WA158_000300 [Blastocystis sp. Blastoise]
MVDQKITEAKIREFEDMIYYKLKPKYEETNNHLEEILKTQQDFSILKQNIESMINSQDEPLKSLVNIGSECYVQAETKDKKHIFIEIGLGFMVEFTLEEGLKYVTKRIDEVNDIVSKRRIELQTVKGHYLSALNAIEQLKTYLEE